jgi:hypothetical protein
MKTSTDFSCWFFTMIFTDQIFLSLTPSVNIDKNISSVYTEGIAVRIKGIKKTKQCDDT